ncbi:hypothetical protein FHR32_008335 [Streptosporangium album]|uniref:Uncharacterized protein n=1 Tax=Streptosporangium album TaxID=47479 RepID=A0A7W7WF13_9ACTN|nr:hypothetical protein [Streptosporangium album]MBB4943934.1 hypothetical protein [Streptosporangium album]
MLMIPPPPRWAVRAAHAVPLVVLPSSLWRVALVAGIPTGIAQPVIIGAGEKVYILSLSVVSELAAFMTLGLVRPWGEVVPRWIPLLGGRRVRPLAAVIPACIGAGLVALICAWAVRGLLVGLTDQWSPAGLAVLAVCYLPLLAWGPLLLAVTWSYWRRHRRPVAAGEVGMSPVGAPPGGRQRRR